MLISGVIFDFNGTLFWDTPIHNKAWDIFFEKHNLYLTDEEKFLKMHGKNNFDLIKELFIKPLSSDEIYALAEEKERLYRSFCLEQKMEMAPGAEDFLDFLKSAAIPINIATASEKRNLDFFFEHLPLSKWFDKEKVVYNNGIIKSKPDPEIYRTAIERIGLQADQVMIFEDAESGIKAATNAMAAKVIIVNSNNDNYANWGELQKIRNYNEVDRKVFHIQN